MEYKIRTPGVNLAKVARMLRAAQIARHFWTLALDYDTIPQGSAFVVFSDENPFVKLYERALVIKWGK
jgi:hypothetical protein